MLNFQFVVHFKTSITAFINLIWRVQPFLQLVNDPGGHKKRAGIISLPSCFMWPPGLSGTLLIPRRSGKERCGLPTARFSVRSSSQNLQVMFNFSFLRAFLYCLHVPYLSGKANLTGNGKKLSGKNRISEKLFPDNTLHSGQASDLPLDFAKRSIDRDTAGISPFRTEKEPRGLPVPRA